MKIVYFISGLGADERVFSQLNLPNIQPVYINWVVPNDEDTMETYAEKLLVQIDTSTPVTIVGLSFGGMLAVELRKLIPNSKIILLSTAAKATAIPKKYRLLGKWNLPNKVPFGLIKKANALTYYFFGVRKKEHQLLLKDVLLNTDEHFFRWAVQAILDWKNKKDFSNVVQIHGTEDKILPLVPVKDGIEIKNGGHFMVLEEAKVLSEVLAKVLGEC